MSDRDQHVTYDVQKMQTRVDRFIRQFEEGYFSPEVMMLRFTEELGELAREVNHMYGPKKKKASEAANTVKMNSVISFSSCYPLPIVLILMQQKRLIKP